MTLEARQLPQLDPSTGLGLAWEQLVQASPESGVMQSLRWARVRAASGCAALHIGLFDDEVLVGGALWHGPVPGTRPAFLVAPDGPVLPWADTRATQAGLRTIMDETRRLLAGTGIVGVRAEPRVTPPLPRALRDFHRAPVDLLPPETLYLDLTPDPDDLLRAMHQKWRYNIRLAGRREVTVREDDTPAAIGTLYRLLGQAAAREQFFLEPASFFAALYEHLVRPGHARILIAEWQGQPLAAMLLVTYSGRATYLYGGTANEHREVMAGYALQWAAIQAGRAAGASTYDFYGFEPHGLPDHLFAGFSRFKRGFGGEPTCFIGAHDHLLMENLADAVIRLVGASSERTPA